MTTENQQQNYHNRDHRDNHHHLQQQQTNNINNQSITAGNSIKPTRTRRDELVSPWKADHSLAAAVIGQPRPHRPHGASDCGSVSSYPERQHRRQTPPNMLVNHVCMSAGSGGYSMNARRNICMAGPSEALLRVHSRCENIPYILSRHWHRSIHLLTVVLDWLTWPR